MNQKGQAYSTFKILIAAIVALAILAILITTLMNIVIPGNNIQDATRQLIQSQAQQPGSIMTSNKVAFSAGSNLASSALIGNNGLSQEQICLHKGDHVGRAGLQISGNSILNNGQDLETRVAVLCDKGNNLMASLQETGNNIQFDGQNGVCGCQLETAQNCCVVILKYA